jgi:hypothetical protein
MSWECPEKKKEGGESHISKAHRDNVEEEGAEDGTSLMMRKVLLKPEEEVKKPVQRNNLFRIACKTKDRVYESRGIVVQGKSIVHTKILNEG